MLRHFSWMLTLAAVLASGSTTSAAPARSDLADFLAILRQRGYADFAAEYLVSRKDDAELPGDVRETWDIEMANCLWIAASQISNDQEANRRREEAQKHLDAFLKEHPNHPAVADAMLTWGTASLDRGVQRVYLSKMTTVEAEKATHLKEARELLTDANSRLNKAIEVCQAQGAPKPDAAPAAAKEDDEKGADPEKAPKGKKKLSEAEAEMAYRLAEARFKVALSDYWFSQTCDEGQADERAARLKSASTVFDEVYRNYRGQLPGYVAHYWQARVKGEVGDDAAIEDALEFCDEVLAIAPDNIKRGEINPAVLSLIGDTMVLRLQLLAKSKQAEMAIEEGASWMKNCDSLKDTPAYQAIAIEWVKTLSANLDGIPDPRHRANMQKSMLTTLGRIARGRGPYQREGSLLLAKVNKQMAGGGKPGADNFDEALAAAESAMIAEQWPSAATGFKRALELLPNSRISAADKRKQEEQILERLAHAQFQVAIGLATANQLADATAAAEKLMKESAKTAIGPAAAALALQTTQKMAADPKLGKEKQQAMVEKLQALADTTLATWPRSNEADEARFVLGQIGLMQNNSKQAVSNLTSLSPTSPRYSAAMLSAGRYAMRRYREEMAKPEKDRNPQVLEKSRNSALEWLTAGVASQKPASTGDAKQDEEREKARRQQSAEVKLMLAEVLMESGKPDQAMVHYQELIQTGLDAKGQTLDDITLRALGAALKANITRGNFDKASELAVELGKRAGDQPQINGLLVNVLRFLVRDLQQAEADVINAGDGDAAAKKLADDHVAAARKRTGNLLSVLADKQQLNAVTMVYLGDNCIRVGLKTEGQAIYQRLLAEAAKNPQLANENAPALTRTRARLVGILSDEKQYPEAVRQINLLLTEHPKAIDLLVQKGRIYQAWSKTDPSHYDDAVSSWTDVRTMLEGAPQKPPEYYEAIYNTAECLIAKCEREKKPESALQAEKLLKGALVLSPQLNGPDTVARFQAMIKKAITLQGR